MWWWIAGLVVLAISLRLLATWRRGGMTSASAPPPQTRHLPFTDEVLGAVEFSAEEESWVVKVQRSGGVTLIGMGAETDQTGRPPADRVAAARCVLADLPAIEAAVERLTSEYADALPAEHAEEARAVRGLRPGYVHIYDAGPPANGMVQFASSAADEGRAWRCWFKGAEVSELNFDS
ncbi:MAG TPA: hypothetical protein VFF65_00790 [Phycisphaerales bacterium]|nr:hypothetical protein [Phycisphaerales bacterium]